MDFSKSLFLGHLGIKDPFRNTKKAEDPFLPKVGKVITTDETKAQRT